MGLTLGTLINCRQTLSFRTSSRTCLVRRANCSSMVASIPQQRLDEFHRQGIVTGEGAYASGKGRAARRAEFEAGLPQQCPHHVLDRSHLVQDREARHQQRAPQPALLVLDVDLAVPPGAQDLRQGSGRRCDRSCSASSSSPRWPGASRRRSPASRPRAARREARRSANTPPARRRPAHY